MTVPSVVGLDVGGANTKACFLSIGEEREASAIGRSRYHEVWRDPRGLRQVMAGLVRGALPHGHPDAIALTMTAELCDVFPTRAAGVEAVVDAVKEVFPDTPLWLWTVGGRFVDAAGQIPPEEVAAANWAASATLLSRACPLGILVDVGSTTTDLIPLGGGKVRARGCNDTERLIWGELLYTGLLRTPAHSLSDRVYVHGKPCRVMHEFFAISADVYRFLNLIDEQDYVCPPPDGTDRSPSACARRLARLVGADPLHLGQNHLAWVARYLKEKQVQQITECLFQVMSSCDSEPDRLPTVITAGQGAFLAAEAAQRLGLPWRPWWELSPPPADQPPGTASGGEPLALTAYAVAVLLAEERGWSPSPRTG